MVTNNIHLPLPFIEYVNTFRFLNGDHWWGEHVFSAMWNIFDTVYMRSSKHAWRVAAYVDIGFAYFIPPLQFSQLNAMLSAGEDGSAIFQYRFPTLHRLADKLICFHHRPRS